MEFVVAQALKKLSGSGSFDLSDPHYELICDDVEKFENEYVELCTRIQKNSSMTKKFPLKMGLIDGLVLLALKQPLLVANLFPGKKMKLENVINRVRGISDSRNKSILAHGTTPLGEVKFKEIYDLAKQLAVLIEGDSFEQLIVDVSPPRIEEYVV